jgi:hypothetical protein
MTKQSKAEELQTIVNLDQRQLCLSTNTFITMASEKRKHIGDHQSLGNNKKSRPAQSKEPRVDPTYGQRSAIPGLDDETAFDDGDELDYSEDMNALAYLRSVRLVKIF